MRYIKDPDSTLDYAVDWSKWLAPDTDTISTSQWLVDAGLTVNTNSHTTTVATVWLTGGTAGTKYTATNRITTAQGRTDDRSISIMVQNR